MKHIESSISFSSFPSAPSTGSLWLGFTLFFISPLFNIMIPISYSKKRIGNYLIGKTIGEGAFAKVKEGLHVLTGEKVIRHY